jgi:hypothetical protein
VRDLVGNPFRPIQRINPTWLTAHAGVAARLAEVVRDEAYLPDGTLNPGSIAMLADALEDAGCTEAVLLRHLRSPGPHVLGCRALDLALGKA